MNKVMVLGAGRGQIPLMDLCHKYGWYVVGVSPKGNYPGIEVADEMCFIDVKEEKAVLKAAEKKDIKAVLTDQLDEGVLTAAYVAEHMGLNGITSNVAQKFTNKYVMRQEAKKLGIYVPTYLLVSDLETAKEILTQISELRFPIIMKPVDSAASRGVFIVNTWEDIKEKFNYSKSCSRIGKVILEQCVVGKEYVIEAFTRNYETTNLVVGHRDYFQIPGKFIPNATVFLDAESASSNLECRIKKNHETIVKGFGLNFGITHGEYLYNEEEDKIYLVEIAARGGGVFISSDLIPAACGVNANDLLVREALGLGETTPIQMKKGAAAYFCYMLPSGIVSRLDGLDAVEEVEGVIRAFFDNIEIGMESNSITDKSSRKGPILVQGNNKSDCYSIIEQVKQVLTIKVINGDVESDAIWHDYY